MQIVAHVAHAVAVNQLDLPEAHIEVPPSITTAASFRLSSADRAGPAVQEAPTKSGSEAFIQPQRVAKLDSGSKQAAENSRAEPIGAPDSPQSSSHQPTFALQSPVAKTAPPSVSALRETDSEAPHIVWQDISGLESPSQALNGQQPDRKPVSPKPANAVAGANEGTRSSEDKEALHRSMTQKRVLLALQELLDSGALHNHTAELQVIL